MLSEHEPPRIVDMTGTEQDSFPWHSLCTTPTAPGSLHQPKLFDPKLFDPEPFDWSDLSHVWLLFPVP